MDNSRNPEGKKWIPALLLQFVILVTMIVSFVLSFQRIPKESAAGISCETLCVLISLFMSLSIRQSGIKEDGKYLLILITTNVVYLLSDSLFYCINGMKELWALNEILNIVYLICPVALTIIFWKLLDQWLEGHEPVSEWENRVLILIAAIQILCIFGSVFGNYYFHIDPATGSYHRGSLYLMTGAVPAILLLICFRRIFRSTMMPKEQMVLLSYPVLPILGSLIQVWYSRYNFVSAGVFISIVFIHTNYFIKKELMISQLETDFERTRLRALQMQVKPHFLYNTLASIAGLCRIEPDTAQEMIYQLSDYMRDNFTDIEKPAVISFQEEVKQLSHYIAIEHMRFPNIHIEWDIQTADFQIPGMTLQPLVENAINHGIRKRKKSRGTIWISSREADREFIVSIRDDGAGFDVNAVPDETEKHYGISNVRARLEMLCGGYLKISSEPGQGTEVCVFIPKDGKGVSYNMSQMSPASPSGGFHFRVSADGS